MLPIKVQPVQLCFGRSISIIYKLKQFRFMPATLQISIYGQLKSFDATNHVFTACKIIQNPCRQWTLAELDTSCKRRTSFTGMPWVSNATLAGSRCRPAPQPVLTCQSEDPTAGCTMLAPDAVARSKYPAATDALKMRRKWRTCDWKA